MLLNARDDLLGSKIQATDENIGTLQDLLFDDLSWIVRYLVVDTGDWLPGRRVLLSPISVRSVDSGEKSVSVKLTAEQVEKSPPVDAHKTVSRQQETELSQYYGWPAYWSAETRTVPMGAVGMPGEVAPPIPPSVEAEDDRSGREEADPHLRSVNEVRGYHIEAQDGEIGHVKDFLINPDMWWVQSMVVDTRNWLPGKKVVVPPRQIDKVRWTERKVFVEMLRDELMASPEAAEILDEQRVIQE